jgi:hypothetical protein
VGKKEPSNAAGGNVTHYGKQFGGSSNLKIELLYDSAISLLGI